MGWLFVNILVPIFSTIGVLLIIQRAPVPDEYRAKVTVIRAVRDGQLGWVVIGIGSNLLYEVFSQAQPNYWVATFAILLVGGNALLSGVSIMFPFQDKDVPPKEASLREKINAYQVLRDTSASLFAISVLSSVHHFLLIPKQ